MGEKRVQDLETREGDGDDGRSQDDSLITCYRCCKAVFAPSTILVVHRYRAGYSHDFRAFPLSVNSCRNYTRIVSKTLIEFRVIVEEEGRVLFDVPLSLSLSPFSPLSRHVGWDATFSRFFSPWNVGDGGEGGRSRKFSSTCYSFTRSYERDVLVLRYVILGRWISKTKSFMLFSLLFIKE